MRNIWFNTEGYAFKTPGDDCENRMNTKIALDVIRIYITHGGHQSEVEEAINWIEREYLKAKPITTELRQYIFHEDMFGYREWEVTCSRIYNRLVKRLG